MTLERLNRRAILQGLGLAAVGGSAALANAPARSLVPQARPFHFDNQVTADAPLDILAQVDLAGQTTYALVDVASGKLLESANTEIALPMASVAKAYTAQYALETFGSNHRFSTRLLATGPIVEGIVKGDLVLVGGGDPMLDTDDLGALAKDLVSAGIRSIEGEFLVYARALPLVRQIDRSQPKHLGYNPGICGLNLNFNRVYFEWKKEGSDYSVRMDARGERHQPLIPVTTMQVVDQAPSVFTYQRAGLVEKWKVVRGALGKGGARWLPVRNPGLYAGYAFRGVAAQLGLKLGAPRMVETLPKGTEVARHESIPLGRIIRSMLYFSTNLIAESLGLSASIKRGFRPANLSSSAKLMSSWLGSKYGAGNTRFVDHSGLGDRSRSTATDLAKAMAGIGPDGLVASQMKTHHLPKTAPKANVVAKTGTLNFVSGLGGFVEVNGRALAFVILSADLPRRNGLSLEQRERPRGAKSWSSRARHQQNLLLESWVRAYG